MRTSSNPVFRNLDKQYATFGRPGGAAQAGGGQFGYAPGQPQQPGQQPQYGQPYGQPAPATPQRAMTIDDVVTKTAMTLGVLVVAAVASFFLVHNSAKTVTDSLGETTISYGLMAPLAFGGLLIGFVLSMFAIFTRRTDRPALVLAYAAAEGVFLGAISFAFAHFSFSQGSQAPGNIIIGQAVLGTFGVFAGMLVVYKTGAIRVTPKFTRVMVGALIGVLVLMIGDLFAGLFFHTNPLRDGGPIAIIFSLVCIGLAALSFLLDFDQADKLIRAGAPERAAWSVAFGLTVTLVWLYLEILRLLSYLQGK